MGLITWIAIVVIVLVVIGLGAGVFFSGLIRGAEIIGTNPAVQNVTQEAKEFLDNNIQGSGSSSSSSVLVITTNEARYRVDEPVTITVKKRGDEKSAMPNPGLGIKDENTKTVQMYRVVTAPITSKMQPGTS